MRGKKDLQQEVIQNLNSTRPAPGDLSYLLESIVKSADDAIVAKDLDGTILFWNKGAEKIYGYRSEEVVGRCITLIIPDIKRDEFHDIMRKLRKGQKLEHHETIRVAKDGSLLQISVTISPILNKDGKILGASAIARDITRQKAIQNERAMLASIVDSSEDAIMSKTLSGIIITWNKGAEKVYGYKSAEVIGRSVSILVPPRRRDELPSFLENIRTGGHIENYETVRMKKDGSLIDVSLTISPIKNLHGTVVGASTIARDITERKRKDDLIRAQLSEKEVLLQEIHHRVKNNLQVISSLLELRSRYVREDEQKNAAFRESIERIRAIALVHEKLYRSENLSTIDLKQYISSLIDDLLLSYRVSNTDINVLIDGTTFYVPLNAAVPLGLVLNELVTNSIKYAFKGRSSGELSVSFQSDDHCLDIVIADNGSGLPVHVDFKTPNSFGFRIVKLLIDQMDATIDVSSENGTKFHIRVPM